MSSLLLKISGILQPLWGIWLMICFLAIIGWTVWPRNKKRFDHSAMIPFIEEEKEDGNHGRIS